MVVRQNARPARHLGDLHSTESSERKSQSMNQTAKFYGKFVNMTPKINNSALTAPFPLHPPVNRLHSIENQTDKSVHFLLT